MNSKAPSSWARRLRSSSPRAVTIMTGKLGNRCLIAASNSRPSMPGHIDLDEDRNERGLNFPGGPIQRLCARGSEMHHVDSLAGLAAKALAKQVGDIRFVVYDQDACAG